MRKDVAALTPEMVASLSNVGLVKRAQREIAGGRGPFFEEDTNGLITARSTDGALVRWPSGAGMREATCTCGASTVCRHRVGVALAYAAAMQSADGASATGKDAWSPGQIDDEALLRLLGARVFEEAILARSRGLLARVHPSSTSDPTPSVALPTCTVRFLVPDAVAFARCECQAGTGCLHVALAVWAFRAIGDASSQTTVELARRDDHVDPADLEPLRALTRWALSTGIANLAAADVLAQRAALARRPLEAGGMVWMVTLLEELAAAVDAYRRRTTAFRADLPFALITEIEARARSALAAAHELPAACVLGRGTPMETRLDKVRLMSLGARLTFDHSGTRARIFLMSPGTGDVLTFDRAIRRHPGARPTPKEIGAQRVAGMALGSLATGGVLTTSAVRRANDELLFRGATQGTTSAMPHAGDFVGVPAWRMVEDVDALDAALSQRPPRMLHARRRGDDVRLVPVEELGPMAFDPAEQMLFATIRQRGGSMLLARRHDAAAPQALDAIAAALRGVWGKPRWIAGDVVRFSEGLRIDPSMIIADRPVVPDLECDPPPSSFPAAAWSRSMPPTRQALGNVIEHLVEAALVGLDHVPSSFSDRLARAADAASTLGLTSVGTRAAALAVAVRRHAADRVDRWLDAAIRAQLTADV